MKILKLSGMVLKVFPFGEDLDGAIFPFGEDLDGAILPFGEDLGGANKAATANPVESLRYE
jgi:hypothetical protein